MEIHQLRYFVAVAEENSFSQAAQREHVSQPSLSQQIHKLEEELNQQLFDRLPRSVVLTAAGRTLLPYARVILTAIADAGRSVTALEAEVAGRLAVGAIPSIALYILPRLIGRFQHAYPKVTFELFEDTTEKLAQRLEDGTLDLVIASGSDESPNLARHSLGRESLLLLVPEKHPFARRKSIRWSDLADEGRRSQRHHRRHRQTAGLFPGVAIELQPEPPNGRRGPRRRNAHVRRVQVADHETDDAPEFVGRGRRGDALSVALPRRFPVDAVE